MLRVVLWGQTRNDIFQPLFLIVLNILTTSTSVNTSTRLLLITPGSERHSEGFTVLPPGFRLVCLVLGCQGQQLQLVRLGFGTQSGWLVDSLAILFLETPNSPDLAVSQSFQSVIGDCLERWLPPPQTSWNPLSGLSDT